MWTDFMNFNLVRPRHDVWRISPGMRVSLGMEE
jgi:hypothetical protein